MSSDKSNQNKPRKKPQKQAADKTRRTSKKKDKKDIEVEVLNNDGSVERTFKVPRNGLTYRQYRELRTKDPNLLNDRDKKKLEEAHEQLRKTAHSLTSQYDFSAMAKLAEAYTIPPIAQQSLARALAIDTYTSPITKMVSETIGTSPIMKMVADMQTVQPSLNRALGIQTAALPAIQALYKSNLFAQNQFTALAAIQKSLKLAYPTESILATIKGIQDAFLAPLIARTMFADFHTAHERILRNLQFDVGSLTASIEFSRFETVDFAVDEVVTDDDNLTAAAVATQTNTVGNITLTDSASIQLAFNDLRQEVHDLRQQLLAKDAQQGKLLVAPSKVHFQRTSSSIQIGQYKVSVTVSAKQTQFARVLLSTPENITKQWDIEDLIFEAFGERIADDEQDWIIKIRSYIHQLNNKVLRDTNNTMPNFFVLDGIKVYVNPEYLNL